MTPRRRGSSRTKGRKQQKARALRRLLVTAVALLLPTGISLVALIAWARLPGPGGELYTPLAVIRAETAPTIGDQLGRAGFIKQPFLFDMYLRLTGRWSQWKSGRHWLKANMTPRDLAACVAQVSSRPRVQITIPEGFDLFRIAHRLGSLGVCAAEDFLMAAGAPDLLKELGIRGKTVEGYLFPLTYAVRVDSEPRVLITSWVAETRRRIDKLNQMHGQALPRLLSQRGWGEFELLTLASMIEKETPHDDERSIIAGIFLNRLDDPDFFPRRMLQSDPTALYGCLVLPSQIPTCAGNGGRVNPAMLRDAQNPYNTYRHPGLPPGPIANPGEASIAAVMTPTPTEYRFFVAKNGRHVFSRSLSEHEAAIRDSSNQ
jgi:UPF0755 protein